MHHIEESRGSRHPSGAGSSWGFTVAGEVVFVYVYVFSGVSLYLGNGMKWTRVSV